MVILKIKQRGLFIEIPGITPIRTPAEIDITRCNIAVVDTYLRKIGVVNYEILSSSKNKGDSKQLDKVKESLKKKRRENKRITELEKKVEKLINQEETKPDSEQITDKLALLEELTRTILAKGPVIIEKRINQVSKNISEEPIVEEMEDTYIPEIDTSNMKIKTGTEKTVKRDNTDLDDSADLLSKIMSNKN